MTRDAEHTPTGYEDAASVVVNQAPAPSSLAGGEVREVVARIVDPFAWRKVDRAREQYADHITEDQRREWSKDPASLAKADAILAALSPEAPAREAWVEALRTALIKARSELAIQYCSSAGRMGIAGCYPELAEKYGGSDIVQEIDAVLALTPRHETPASHAFEASHSIKREGGCRVCGHDEASHEAPAEGAGEDLLSAIDTFMPSAEVAFLWSKETPPADEVQRYRERYWAVKEALLRARSSAPEAREGEAVRMEVRVVGTEKWFTVHHDHEEVFRRDAGYETRDLFTHPAAPSADKLRIAVEALEQIEKDAEEYQTNGTEHDAGFEKGLAAAAYRADQALAALKAEGA